MEKDRRKRVLVGGQLSRVGAAGCSGNARGVAGRNADKVTKEKKSYSESKATTSSCAQARRGVKSYGGACADERRPRARTPMRPFLIFIFSPLGPSLFPPICHHA